MKRRVLIGSVAVSALAGSARGQEVFPGRAVTIVVAFPPGGQADVDVVCAFDSTCIGCDVDGGSCATGTIDFSLARNSGKPVTQNITSYFRATGCIDIAGEEGVCDTGDIAFRNEWIFNIEQLLYYYWDYDNYGNKLVNIRFCNTEDVEGACEGGTIVL